MERVLRNKLISLWGFAIIFAISVIHITITAISIYNNPTTSFPWWTAFYFPGVLYLIPMVISLSMLLYFIIKARKYRL